MADHGAEQQAADRADGRRGPFWDVLAGRAPVPPIAQLLGWHLESIDPEAGTIVVRFDARPGFTNPVGDIQGGMIAAMLDDTMGPALVATLGPGEFAPTLEMKVSYLRPARVGRLWGHGRVVHRGGTVSFVEADLVDPDGHVVARASATTRIVRIADRARRTDPGSGTGPAPGSGA